MKTLLLLTFITSFAYAQTADEWNDTKLPWRPHCSHITTCTTDSQSLLMAKWLAERCAYECKSYIAIERSKGLREEAQKKRGIESEAGAVDDSSGKSVSALSRVSAAPALTL